MKYFLCLTLSILALSAQAQIPVADKEDLEKELQCSKKVKAYIDGLEAAYESTKTAESKEALESARHIKATVNPCVAQDQIQANLFSKKAK